MHKFHTVFAAAALACLPALAGAVPTEYRLDPALGIVELIPGLFDRVSLEGSITISPEDVRAARDRGDVFTPVSKFDLELDLLIQGAQERLLQEFALTDVTGQGFLNTQATKFMPDGTWVLDTTGLAPGTPLINFDIDMFPEATGFPDGRRLGDDAQDLLLVQLFAGSVNIGVAAFDNDPFFIDPIFAQFGQISPEDSIVFSRAVPAAPVPLPAGIWGLLAALAAMWGLRRRVV